MRDLLAALTACPRKGRGEIAIYQTLLRRPDRGRGHVPLTREDWYGGTGMVPVAHLE